MKRGFCFVVLAALSLPSWADELVTMSFHQARLVDVARIAFEDIDQVPFTMSHDFIGSPYLVTLSLKGLEKRRAVAEIQSLIADAGFASPLVDGVVQIGKPKAEAENDFIYRPKFRSVSYLVDLVSGFFTSGSFSNQRQVQSRQSALPPPPTAGRPPVQDSGTSAYSLQDKNQADVLVFRGSVAEVKRLENLIAQLDTATAELIVKGVILEVTTDSKEQNALTLAASVLGGKFGLTLGRRPGSDYSAMVSLAGIDAVVAALSTDSRFKVLSSPTLRVRSGSTAKLTVGSDTPILGAVQMNQQGQSIQSVEYKPSGVILELTPQIKENITELTIRQQLSNFVLTTTGVNGSPTLTKRELSTVVGVNADDVVVLGGLDEDKSSSDRSGLAWLPWFKSTGQSNQKTEIMLMLQAQKI